MIKIIFNRKKLNQNCNLLVTPFGKGMGDGTFLTFVSSKGTSSFGIGLRKDWALAIFWGDLGWSNTLDFTVGFCKQPLSTSDTLPFVLKRMKKFGKNPKLKHDRIKKYKKEKKNRK